MRAGQEVKYCCLQTERQPHNEAAQVPRFLERASFVFFFPRVNINFTLNMPDLDEELFGGPAETPSAEF